MILAALNFKDTNVGHLIYIAMLLYVVAGIALLIADVRKGKSPAIHKLGQLSFAAGFVVALAGLIYRGFEVQHLPMRSMFEVFFTLGVLVFPISIFSKHFLKVGLQFTDAFLGAVILFPAGFVFSSHTSQLPPALQTPLFLPHVGAYMIGYVIIAKATICACMVLVSPKHKPADQKLVDYDIATDRIMRLGLPFMSVGLLLGAYWAQLAFGDFWQWDPKESWSLATWLMIICYFHLRYITGRKHLRLQAATVVLTALFMILTLLWSQIAPLLKNLFDISLDSYHLYSS